MERPIPKDADIGTLYLQVRAVLAKHLLTIMEAQRTLREGSNFGAISDAMEKLDTVVKDLEERLEPRG